MKFLLVIGSACGLFLLAACAEEQPPVSASQFMENSRLLEATMVRCARNRSETKYDAECVNARDAVNRLEAANERDRREQLEAQSESAEGVLRHNVSERKPNTWGCLKKSRPPMEPDRL